MKTANTTTSTSMCTPVIASDKTCDEVVYYAASAMKAHQLGIVTMPESSLLYAGINKELAESLKDYEVSYSWKEQQAAIKDFYSKVADDCYVNGVN